jgi:hypothetical protein
MGGGGDRMDYNCLLTGGNRAFCFFPTVFQISSVAQLAAHPTLSLKEIRRGVKLTIHLHLLQSPRIVDIYLYSPICLHGKILN